MINGTNIAAYIAYLYRQKYAVEAPADVLASWAPLPDAEIPQHLQALYQHWGLDAAAAQAYEQAFLNSQKPAATVQDFYKTPQATPAIPPIPVYQAAPAATYPPPRRKSSFWKVVAILLILTLLGAGAYFGWQVMQEKNTRSDNFTTQQTTTEPVTTAPAAVPEEPLVTDLPKDEADEVNIDIIHQLLAAEDQQDLTSVMRFYAPYMERYWDISYPTQEQLQQRYTDSWQNISDAHNTINNIRKVAPGTYDVNTSFNYFLISKQKARTTKSTLRFVFNDEHQITQVYKLK